MPFVVLILAALPVMAIAGLLSARHHRQALVKKLKSEWGRATPGRSLDPDALTDIMRYWRELYEGPGRSDCVDDITWSDLDMDAVFQHLNCTQSNVGEEALCAMLREIGVDDETLRRRNRWIQALGKDEPNRLRIQMRLRKIGKDRYHGVYPFLTRPDYKRPAHPWVYYILAFAPILFLALGFINPYLLIGVAVSFAVNMVVYYRSRTVWMSEHSAIRHLAAVLHCARRLQKYPIDEMGDAANELHALCAELKPIARWNALYAMERTSNVDFLTDYVRIAFQLDMISLTRLVAFLRKHTEQVARLYALVGELDACIAIASTRASLTKYAVPEFVREAQVSAQGLAHPLIANPVRNNMDWGENALITGSNASGKSTFIKALALNAIFAQSICTCWAERFSMPRAQVLSSMALRDNVQGGDSYFIVEIKSLRRILTALREDKVTLCFIDEILRGTNTIERIASSASLLRYLSSQNVLCIAATHDVELPQMLTMYKQYHFREEMTPQGMTFSYRLMHGACDTRNAIRLLEQMAFPLQVIASADEMAARFDATCKWI
jgi:hypothetical protein